MFRKTLLRSHARLARLRFHTATWQAHAELVLADDLDIHLLPQGGAAWRPQGTREEVRTPGTHGLFRELLTLLDATYPTTQITRLDVVVDNYCMHKAKAVEQWVASHPKRAKRDSETADKAGLSQAWCWSMPQACPPSRL
jgi:hypothetical protein